MSSMALGLGLNLAAVPKLAPQMVAATLRTIFPQRDADSAHDTVERVCRLFEKRYPELVVTGPRLMAQPQ
jgi:transposase-like protein